MRKKLKNKKTIIGITIMLCVLFFCVSVFAATILKSDIYKIDTEKKYIAIIKPKTEITSFKQNGGFNVNANDINVYTNVNKTKKITEGYMKTGMVAEFSGVNGTYKTSVLGDINGDGMINTIDLTRIVWQLVGLKEKQLGEIELISGDINIDNEVNQIDLSLMIRYILTGNLYEKATLKVEKNISNRRILK